MNPTDQAMHTLHTMSDHDISEWLATFQRMGRWAMVDLLDTEMRRRRTEQTEKAA